MVRIRLRRVGAKKQPSYRIVVADQRSPRNGRFIEAIGHFNPRTEPETVNYDEERALYWLSVGAQPSEAVQRLFKNFGTYERLKRLHKGEEIEALVEEALAEAEKREPVDPRTSHSAGKPSKRKKQADPAEVEEEEAVESVAEAEADSGPEAEAEVVDAEEAEEAEEETETAEEEEEEAEVDGEEASADEEEATPESSEEAE